MRQLLLGCVAGVCAAWATAPTQAPQTPAPATGIRIGIPTAPIFDEMTHDVIVVGHGKNGDTVAAITEHNSVVWQYGAPSGTHVGTGNGIIAIAYPASGGMELVEAKARGHGYRVFARRWYAGRTPTGLAVSGAQAWVSEHLGKGTRVEQFNTTQAMPTGKAFPLTIPAVRDSPSLLVFVSAVAAVVTPAPGYDTPIEALQGGPAQTPINSPLTLDDQGLPLATISHHNVATVIERVLPGGKVEGVPVTPPLDVLAIAAFGTTEAYIGLSYQGMTLTTVLNGRNQAGDLPISPPGMKGKTFLVADVHAKKYLAAITQGPDGPTLILDIPVDGSSSVLSETLAGTATGVAVDQRNGVAAVTRITRTGGAVHGYVDFIASP